MAKILALDYGEKRIGVAFSDESGSIAFAYPHLDARDFRSLLDLIAENEVDEIIVGYPISMEGGESEGTKKTKVFVERLKASVEAPVWLIDERLSTKEVLRELADMGQDYKKSKEMIDSFVAQKMLERHLEKIKK